MPDSLPSLVAELRADVRSLWRTLDQLAPAVGQVVGLEAHLGDVRRDLERAEDRLRRTEERLQKAIDASEQRAIRRYEELEERLDVGTEGVSRYNVALIGAGAVVFAALLGLLGAIVTGHVFG